MFRTTTLAFLWLALTLASQATLAAEAITLHFVGEEKILSAEGALLQSSVYVGRRIHLPEENLIKVDILYVRAGKAVRRHVVEKRVEGNKFKITDPEGTYTGDGELHGTAWKWDRWNYKLAFTDGSSMTGQDHSTSKGILMKKEFFTKEGKPSQTVAGDFSFVSPETYAILAEKLLPENR